MYNLIINQTKRRGLLAADNIKMRDLFNCYIMLLFFLLDDFFFRLCSMKYRTLTDADLSRDTQLVFAIMKEWRELMFSVWVSKKDTVLRIISFLFVSDVTACVNTLKMLLKKDHKKKKEE